MLRYGLFGKLGLLSKRNFLGKINELVSDVGKIDEQRIKLFESAKSELIPESEFY